MARMVITQPIANGVLKVDAYKIDTALGCDPALYYMANLGYYKRDRKEFNPK